MLGRTDLSTPEKTRYFVRPYPPADPQARKAEVGSTVFQKAPRFPALRQRFVKENDPDGGLGYYLLIPE